MKGTPVVGMENAHVSMGKFFAELIGFLFMTPFIVVGLTSLVLPLLFGMGGVEVTDQYITFLEKSMRFEKACALISAPEVKLGSTVLLEEAWNYRIGESICRQLIPGNERGLFLDDRLADQVEHKSGVTDHVEKVHGDGGNTAISGVNAKAHLWFQDRFYPVLRVIVTVTVARLFILVEMLMLAIFMLPALWYYGGYLARRRDEMGIQPLGHRYRFYVKGVLWTFATTVLVVVLPLPLPAALVIPFLFAIIIWFIVLARGHVVINL